MRLVVVESPLAGDVERNLAYLRLAMKHCLLQDEAPFASHDSYPRVLNDHLPGERALGMAAGFAWGDVAQLTAVYADFGVSGGMVAGIARAHASGRPVEERRLFVWCCELPWVVGGTEPLLVAHGAERRLVGAQAPLLGACRQCRERLPALPAPRRVLP